MCVCVCVCVCVCGRACVEKVGAIGWRDMCVVSGVSVGKTSSGRINLKRGTTKGKITLGVNVLHNITRFHLIR